MACRRCMEAAARPADPDRWARYVLRRRQEEAVEADAEPVGPSSRGTPRAIEDPNVAPEASERDEDDW